MTQNEPFELTKNLIISEEKVSRSSQGSLTSHSTGRRPSWAKRASEKFVVSPIFRKVRKILEPNFPDTIFLNSGTTLLIVGTTIIDIGTTFLVVVKLFIYNQRDFTVQDSTGQRQPTVLKSRFRSFFDREKWKPGNSGSRHLFLLQIPISGFFKFRSLVPEIHSVTQLASLDSTGHTQPIHFKLAWLFAARSQLATLNSIS